MGSDEGMDGSELSERALMGKGFMKVDLFSKLK